MVGVKCRRDEGPYLGEVSGELEDRFGIGGGTLPTARGGVDGALTVVRESTIGNMERSWSTIERRLTSESAVHAVTSERGDIESDWMS
jgi:hypothetical protein